MPTGIATRPSCRRSGEIMEVITAGAFDGKAYDAAYPERLRADHLLSTPKIS